VAFDIRRRSLVCTPLRNSRFFSGFDFFRYRSSPFLFVQSAFPEACQEYRIFPLAFYVLRVLSPGLGWAMRSRRFFLPCFLTSTFPVEERAATLETWSSFFFPPPLPSGF